MFKNKQRHLLISMLLMVLFLVTLGTAFSTDLNETLEVGEVSINKDNSENSQIQSSENEVLTTGDKKFSEIQDAINNATNGQTIYLEGYYSAENNDSVVYVNKNIKIEGKPDTVLDGRGVSSIFSIQKGGSNSVIDNLKFVNGKSDYGGAMLIHGKNVTIQNSVFENNHADYGGGAIYVRSNFEESPGRYPEDGEDLVIKNCNFINNFAQVTAGAIGVYGNNTQIIGCHFLSNKVKPDYDHEAYGGAIQIGRDGYYLIASVKDCDFTNNQAIAHSLNTSHGGAGCIRDGVVYQNCNFTDNFAAQGGALTFHASGVIRDCIFTHNSATLYGGALSTGYAEMNMNLKVIDCDFKKNNAPLGGAAQLKGENIEIVNSKFNENVASVNGGAINIVARTVTLNHDNFTRNVANVNGGAVYINGDMANVLESSFIANEAIPDVRKLDDGLGGAIYINSFSATVSKNTFNHNVARNGSAIYYDKFGFNCIVSGNSMAQNQAWVYALPISAKNIYYGDVCEISTTLFGGNNIAKYGDLFVSNAIYNAASQDKIKIDGQTPVLGATNTGNLYQDSREYNMDISLIVTHEDGSVVWNDVLKSDYKGEVSINLENLKPGKYKVTATHNEDTYYKYITNITYFTVYPKADIQVNKSTDLLNVNYRDIVIWTLNITNNGPNNGEGIKLKDLIPNGLVVLSCDDKNYNQKTGILDIASLNVGESKIINIKTLVNKTGRIINEASVSSETYDWNLENNKDSAGIDVNKSADLAIEKLVNDTNPNFNSLVKWTLKVTNNGPDAAIGVVVRDILPDGLVCMDKSFTGTWNIGNLGVGKSVYLDIVTLVNKTGRIINEASVSGDYYDWNLDNNKDSKEINVNKSADLAIVKLVNDTNPNFDSLVKWTLKVTNNGPNTATEVVVCDILPDGLVCLDESFTGTWNIGNLDVGESISIDIVTLVNKTGKIINEASVSGDYYDWNLENNKDSAEINVNKSSDLAIVKLVNDTNPNFDSLIKWTLIAINNGPDTATGVVVRDILPDALVCLDESFTGTWDVGDLLSGQTKELSIVCLVNKTGKIVNIANITGNEYDWNKTNNIVNKTVYVNASVDLAIEKLVNDTNPNFNSLVKWTLRATNNGPNTATEVVVCDILPDGLVCLDESFTGVWSVGDLLSGQTKELSIVCLVNKTGELVNIANITGNEYDWNKTNNIVNKTVYVNASADLAIVKLVNDTNPNFNSLVKWTLVVTNNGPDIATGVVVCDILSDGLVNLNKSFNGTWNIGNLDVGESISLDIVTLVNKTGKIVNEASVSGDYYDWNLSNNKDSKEINVNASADLAIVKLVNDTNPNFNSLVKWTLKVTNNGPDTATGVVVYDILPDGLVCMDNSFNGVWSVGELLPGQTKELSIVCLVNKTGELVNVANITGNEYDWNKTNNIANKSINVKPSADVYVKKYVDNSTPDFGEIIKWTIVVSNNGPDTATNVKVKDVLDNGLIFVKSILTNGNYDINSGIWTIESLAPKTNETLDIYCKVNKLGEILNVVSVNSTEYDWNPSNNQDNESITPVPVADLSVIKLVNNSNPNYNDLVKWSIIVKNNGPNLATEVVVTDLLPSGLEYISASRSYNPTNGTWYIGNLDVGGQVQLDIVSKIVKTGDITNVVKVKGNEKDNNVTNNNYEKSIHVNPAADLSIKKSVSKQEVMEGDLINYLIEISNNGPDTAQNVKVSELLNSNLKLLSFKATKGIFNNETKVLTVDSIASGEKVLLTVGAVATSTGYFENKVVVSSDTFDYNESNNQDEAYVNVSKKVDSVEKQGHSLVNNVKNSIQKSLNPNLESLTEIPSLATVELPKTGIPIVLLLLVAIFSIGFLPIKISKKR